MESRKIKITIFYRDLNVMPNEFKLRESYDTVIIIDKIYLLELLPSLINQTIERIEVCEYDK